MAQGIHKTKRGPLRGTREAKKMNYKKPTDLEGEEITSNDSDIEENKGEKDDFFIESEEGKYLNP